MIEWAMERVHRRGFAKDPPPTNNKQAGDGRTYGPLPLLRRPSVTAVVRCPGDGEQAGARKRRRRSRSRRLCETALAPSQAGVLYTTSLS